MKTEDAIKIIRASTRALAFLVPTITLCGGLFWGPESLLETIVGAIIGSVATAGIFYFQKDES